MKWILWSLWYLWILVLIIAITSIFVSAGISIKTKVWDTFYESEMPEEEKEIAMIGLSVISGILLFNIYSIGERKFLIWWNNRRTKKEIGLK